MAAMTILIPQAIVLTSLVDTAFRVTGVEYRMKVNSAYSPRVVWILVQDVDIVTQKWCSSNELTKKRAYRQDRGMRRMCRCQVD